MAEETESDEYQSGPYCRHWSDANDCPDTCAACGHRCTEHEFAEPGACFEYGCECKAWTNGEG